MTPQFKNAVKAFIAAANAEIDDLEEKINEEEEKDSPNEEKIDDLSTLKVDIENALEAVENIDIGE